MSTDACRVLLIGMEKVLHRTISETASLRRDAHARANNALESGWRPFNAGHSGKRQVPRADQREHRNISWLRKLPASEWSEEVCAVVKPESATELERGLVRPFAHAPETANSVAELGATLPLSRTLPDRMVELVRLRIADHNQCCSCMAIRYQDAVADGVTEDLICELEMPQLSGALTDSEKVAIRFADTFATSHLAVTGQTYDELEQFFSESEMDELGVTVALFVGFCRLAATFDMVEELSERFQDKSLKQLAPWNEQYVLVR